MLRPEPIGPIPEETARIARAAFRKGSPAMKLRDELGTLYEDTDFKALFPTHGQPGIAPWRLALITVLQFSEHLTDRQAADAVRGRLDWKYALGLDLCDPGFDFSVLCEFRARLLQAESERLLLDRMLERFKDKGLVKARGKQRTDSTHVLSSVRTLSRLELIGETLRAALNELATAAPEWLRGVAEPGWFERYSRRVEEFHLPKGQAARDEYVAVVGEDGFTLLALLDADPALESLRELPAAQALRLAWSHHLVREHGRVRLRTSPELGAAGERFNSPYDTEAHHGKKGSREWNGYKVHVTETCDEDAVHVITHVQTTPATVNDVQNTAGIHEALEGKGLLPLEHFVDSGYVNAELLVTSLTKHGVKIVGPAKGDPSWQNRSGEGYDLYSFHIDWEAKRARCPQGKLSTKWCAYENKGGMALVNVRFAQSDCSTCPVRALCTRSKLGARELTLRPREHFEALKSARDEQTGEEWKRRYEARAGIEGTISQGVRAFGARRSRYRGQAKTGLQQVATAAGINVGRVASWLDGQTRGRSRTSRFAALRTA